MPLHYRVNIFIADLEILENIKYFNLKLLGVNKVKATNRNLMKHLQAELLTLFTDVACSIVCFQHFADINRNLD